MSSSTCPCTTYSHCSLISCCIVIGWFAIADSSSSHVLREYFWIFFISNFQISQKISDSLKPENCWSRIQRYYLSAMTSLYWDNPKITQPFYFPPSDTKTSLDKCRIFDLDTTIILPTHLLYDEYNTNIGNTLYWCFIMLWSITY